MPGTEPPDKPEKNQQPQAAPAAAKANKRVLPLAEEELIVERRQVKTGSVRVDKQIVEEKKAIEVDVRRDFVEVQRIRKNQIVQSVPRVQRVGESLIIPVVEEEVVVTKRLVLKEEVHLVKRRATERVRRIVPVLKETARISRFDRSGKSVDARRPSRPVDNH